jgi:CheY-like chemotaxis protein
MSDPLAGRHRVPAVLVVDDDEGVRVVTRRTLEEAGYQVWEAADGVQALSFLLQGVVDVIVSDIRMPRMDGWDLAAHLRNMTPAPPVLFVSGYDAHIGSGNLPGPVLAKPFSAERLLDAVQQLLLARQTRTA